MRSPDRVPYTKGRPMILSVAPGHGGFTADEVSGNTGKENLDLTLGGLFGIRCMDQILPGDRSEVPTNGPTRRGNRVSRTGQRPHAFDHPLTLDDHRNDRSGRHEVDQGLVERLADMLGV